MNCSRWRVTTLDAILRLVIVLHSLGEVPGKLTPQKRQDGNLPRGQMIWCEKTKTCAGCAESKGPVCSGRAEPPLGGDLCGCCSSCVAIRDAGESCGSQLSVWPEVPEAGSVSSSVTILATSWCAGGLVCVNFLCLDFNADAEPQASNVFGQDTTPLEPEATLPTAELRQRTATPLRKPILVNHDDPDLRKTASPARIVPIQSSAAESLTESRERPEPCHAESGETMTISSYPSDDLLGRVATTTLNGSRFQLVYTGELISELKVLLNVVDRLHPDTPLGDGSVDFLADGFLGSSSPPPDDGLFSARRDGDEATTPSVAEARETATPRGLNNLGSLNPREKRDLERTDEDPAGYEAPKNIQDLIRSASAHRDYVDMVRGLDRNGDHVSDENGNEPSSRGDESTVRVHITNRPRKIQTLVDLEEDEEEEENDGGRRSLQLVNRGNAKDAGKLPPPSDEQNGAQRPSGTDRAPEQNGARKEAADPGAADDSRTVNALWNETLMLSGRLALAEVRISVFERVLEELAKWCNLGVFSMTRDCPVPQTSDIRYGSETDEHLAVASGIDPVRIPEKGRKSRTRIPEERLDPDFSRTLIGTGSPRRPFSSGRRGANRPATSSCGNQESRGSSRSQRIAGALRDPPGHGTVQRSGSATNPASSDYSRLDRRAGLDHAVSPDTRPFRILHETQIPVPRTLAKGLTVLRDLEGRDSSRGTPSGVTFVAEEKSGVNEEERRSFPRMKSGLGKLGLQRGTGRAKRSVARIGGNDEHQVIAGALLADGTGGIRKSRETIARRLLFRHSDLSRSAESTAISMSTQEARKVLDQHAATYSVTDNEDSTIRAEVMNGTECEDGSLIEEDDFDHIYESMEAEDEEGDFEQDIAYDRVEYVDGSNVEIVAEAPPRLRESKMEFGAVIDLSKDGIHPVIFPHERSWTAPRNEDDLSGSGRRAKREMPLPLLFGSIGKYEPKTIVWPSKWIEYRGDIRLGAAGSGSRENGLNSRSSATGSYEITTTLSPKSRTTERLIRGRRLGN